MRWLLIFSTFVSALPANADVSGEHFYVIKRGEVVSEVLCALKFRPIYGPTGNLVKLAAANPDIVTLDHVKPDQKIYIPKDVVEKALKRGRFEIAANGEIIPKNFDRESAREVASEEKKADDKKVALQEKTPKEPASIETVTEAANVAASPVPAAAPLVAPTEEKIGHTFEFETTYKFSSLEATDKATRTTAQVLTSRDIEAGVSWKQQWHSDVRSFGTFAIRNVAFEPTPAGSKVIATNEKSAARFEIGAEQDFADRFHIRSSFEYSQQLFVRGYNSTTIIVDAVAVPSVGIGATYDLLSRDGTKFSIRGEARYMFAAQGQALTVEAGQKLSGGLTLQKVSANGKSLAAEIGYYQNSQNTSLTTQIESGAYGTISFSMPLFGEAP